LLKQEQYQDDPLLSGYREIALRLTSVSILMTIRTGDLELAERQLNAQSDGQGQLPRILTVVAIIRRSYDVLETSPEQFVAQDRIEQAELTLEQGVSMLQESDPLELGDEIAILNELTSLYQGVNKAGSDFQEEAAARVDRLKADYGLGKKHKFVSRFEVELNALTLWYNQRQNIFEALNHNQFQKAHQLITDVPTRIRRAVTWLNEPDQPDWQGWETYLEEMIAIWSDVADEPAKYDLLEAANRLTVLSETIPAGLTSNQVAALKEKLAQDVVQLQTELRKLEDKEETRKDTLVIEGLRHLHEGSLAEALRLIEYAPSDGSTGCFRSLCMGYEYLYDKEKSLSTDERIDYARTALEQAQVHRPSQAVANALNKEQIILQRLIEVYDQLHSNAASWSDLTEAIGAIQEQPAATYLHKRRSGHFFVLKLTEQLAVLDKWVGHRNRAANFWFLGQYDRATRQLAQIKPEDETALNWLNETLQQEWADWKKFNGQIGQGLVNWRKYEYAATAAQFYQAKEHIPDGLSQDTAISLANKLSLMAADLSAIDQRLTYSRTLLQEAEAFYQDKTNLVLIREYLSWELFRYSSDSLLFDPFLYTVVGTQLEVARKLEHKWQTACKADYIGPIFTRFQRFTNHAISRDLKQLQKVIGEDFGKEDPLQQGYLNVESLIVKGLQPDAPRQDYTLARKLAPEQSSFQNEKVRQLFRGGVFPGCLVLAILVLFCIFTVLMTSIIAPAIWPNDESIAANDEPAPTSMNEQVAALPTVPTSISNPGATSNPTNIDPELQLTSTASEAGQEAVRAEPTATTTPSPAPSPEPTNSEQPSEVMSPTPTLTPTAEAPSLPTSRPGPTPAPVDLFTLAKWSPDELIWATTGPIIYQNADGQWNLRSDRTEGHVFWVQEVFQHFPLAVEANVFLGRPNGRYGLVVESVDRQKGFALHTQVDPLTDQGMYTIEIKHQDGESSQGSLLEYNTGFGKNVFEIKIREDLVEFIVNGQTVGTFQSDEKLEAGWRIGINLEVDGQLADSSGDNKRLGHLIIDPTDSIKVYQLPPLQ
ncbi:MAG: hypothetical protein OES12_04440, partial [Anaerolineae bacterium]|nr:hypothetical protein [Anaerolineae bacterium]